MYINVLKLEENWQIFSRQATISFGFCIRYIDVNKQFSVLVCCSAFSIRKVQVETNNNHTRRDIYNVIAVLRGSVEPGGFLCAHYNVTAVLSRSVEPGASPFKNNVSAVFRASVEPGGCPCAYYNVIAVYY